ncbi:MAG TPA: hypothetical protein VEI08_02895 [Candidatus Bathyarchaeia archaeon]|nr:hypothetical protein [Candidatus Bathyarchaeia archaeon]
MTEPAKRNGDRTAVLETFSRSVAGVVLAVYAAGFLVVSLYNASFGFSELSPFKSKILAAGAWCLLLVAVPTYAALRIYRHDGTLTWSQGMARAAVASLSFYIACVGLTLASMYLFEFPASLSHLKRDVVTSVVYGILWVAGIQSITFGWKNFMTQPPKVALFCCGILISLAGLDISSALHFSSGTIRLWFFGVGAVAALVDRNARDAKRRLEHDWAREALFLLFGFSAFPVFVYPHIKSGWGGGVPVPVTICFSSASTISPGQQIPTRLLDESDAGFYVLDEASSKAVFIPRGSVGAVYFSDRPRDFRNLGPNGAAH